MYFMNQRSNYICPCSDIPNTNLQQNKLWHLPPQWHLKKTDFFFSLFSKNCVKFPKKEIMSIFYFYLGLSAETSNTPEIQILDLYGFWIGKIFSFQTGIIAERSRGPVFYSVVGVPSSNPARGRFFLTKKFVFSE